MAGSIAWVQDFLVVTEKYRRSTMNLTAYDLPSGTDLRVVFAPSGETPSWTMTSVGGREEQYLIGCSEQHITCWNMSRDKLSSSIHVALRPHSRFRVPSLIYSFQAGEFQVYIFPYPPFLGLPNLSFLRPLRFFFCLGCGAAGIRHLGSV